MYPPPRDPVTTRQVGPTSWPPARATSDNLLDHFSLDERQAFVASQVGIRQFVLVEAELVQDRRVHVAEMDRVFDGVQTDGVGGADDLASLDAAAGHPHREAQIVVVASLA